MKNKIFLTSIFAIAFACPAMAVDGNATIENGDTCNVDNLGTSTNNDTANLEAIWTLQSIECPAGTSFNASTASCDTCASGSWCVAGTYDVENNATGAGATSCSTLSNGDYPLSASGSSANTACYRNCANADVDHATQVSGSYYYGDNNQCSATECAAGWHIKPGFNIANEFANANPSNSSWGWVSAPNGWNNNTATFSDGVAGHNAAYYGLTGTDANTWGAVWNGFGTMRGIARCSTVNGGSRGTVANGEITDETGENGAFYCYCKSTEFKADGTSDWVAAGSSWVFSNSIAPVGDCANNCAYNCANYVGVNAGFRSALFGAIQPSLATCEANNIGLAWYNDTVANNGTTITPNNSAANQCSYSGTITVPTNTMEKAGYTFGGWKLRTNN